jgi:carbon-monoxide dehydrogenase small subunit
MSEHSLSLSINGQTVRGHAEARWTLADFLRQKAGLTGTHVGCEHGVCGACTVIVDGRAVRACLMLAVQAEGAEVRTVEGLAAADGTLHPIQQAMKDCHALQCGFCTPGIAMTLCAAMEATNQPSEAMLTEAMTGHVCRCTGYQGIRRAIRQLIGQPTGIDA